jgi:hypothetical protein
MAYGGGAHSAGDHLDFPHVIDFGVLGLLVLLLLALKVAYGIRLRGEAPPGKPKEPR